MRAWPRVSARVYVRSAPCLPISMQIQNIFPVSANVSPPSNLLTLPRVFALSRRDRQPGAYCECATRLGCTRCSLASSVRVSVANLDRFFFISEQEWGAEWEREAARADSAFGDVGGCSSSPGCPKSFRFRSRSNNRRARFVYTWKPVPGAYLGRIRLRVQKRVSRSRVVQTRGSWKT